MRRAVVGSRQYRDPLHVKDVVLTIPTSAIVVSGGARGVDSYAVDVHKERGGKCDVKRPDPEIVKAAGFRHAAFVRNGEIVLSSHKVDAFWDGQSSGTANAIAQAVMGGVPVKVHGPYCGCLLVQQVHEFDRGEDGCTVCGEGVMFWLHQDPAQKRGSAQ